MNLQSDTAFLDTLFTISEERECRGTYEPHSESEYKAKEMLSGLIKSSYELLATYEINDVDSLSDQETLAVALLLYADYMDNHPTLTRGGSLSGNHYVDCILAAMGVKELSRVATDGITNYIAKYGTKDLVKVIGKFVGSKASYIGWGLTLYDFVTCV